MVGGGSVEVEAEGHEGNAKVRWRYPGGIVVETGGAPKPGGPFFSERGQLNIDRNRFNIMPAELKRELLRGVDVAESDESDHMRNFLDCVRSRKRHNADVEVEQRSVTVAHLGNSGAVNRPPTRIDTSMPLPSFHDWLANRSQEPHQADNLAKLIARVGAAGISLDRLRTLVPLSPEILQEIIKSLTATGQVVVLKVNGQIVYRTTM
jgi:hypothetical protein